MSDEDSPEKSRDVAILKIIESHATARVVIVCIAIVVCVTVVARAYVKVPNPGWIPVAAALVIPAPVMLEIIKIYRRYVQKNHRRTAALESLHDPNRTSSDRPAEPVAIDPPNFNYGHGQKPPGKGGKKGGSH